MQIASLSSDACSVMLYGLGGLKEFTCRHGASGLWIGSRRQAIDNLDKRCCDKNRMGQLARWDPIPEPPRQVGRSRRPE